VSRLGGPKKGKTLTFFGAEAKGRPEVRVCGLLRRRGPLLWGAQPVILIGLYLFKSLKLQLESGGKTGRAATTHRDETRKESLKVKKKVLKGTMSYGGKKSKEIKLLLGY